MKTKYRVAVGLAILTVVVYLSYVVDPTYNWWESAVATILTWVGVIGICVLALWVVGVGTQPKYKRAEEIEVVIRCYNCGLLSTFYFTSEEASARFCGCGEKLVEKIRFDTRRARFDDSRS